MSQETQDKVFKYRFSLTENLALHTKETTCKNLQITVLNTLEEQASCRGVMCTFPEVISVCVTLQLEPLLGEDVFTA